ncbi:MAG: transketolase, partial [Candidatus Pacebacteria bacterium CG10_big_fil_rev_8_21_14_0_10_45_6]
EQVPTRNGYGEGLVAAARKDERIVALCADLTESTRTDGFRDEFPERFFNIGVAEQNLTTVAAGLAQYGKIPFIASYAMFSPGRAWEQVRTTICYNNVPVKIVGAHAGVSVGPDGATHQAIEDIAIMRTIPKMNVVVPCDTNEGRKAVIAAAKIDEPFYLRFTREKTPVFTTTDTNFEIGRAEIFFDNKDPEVAIIGCGPVLHNAMLAASELEQDGIRVRVINNHTIKPLDEDTIVAAARDAGAVVTVEEHQVMGGMGSAVAECLARECPVPIEFIGVQDRFGESGEPNELIEHFGMGKDAIVLAVRKVLKRK